MFTVIVYVCTDAAQLLRFDWIISWFQPHVSRNPLIGWDGMLTAHAVRQMIDVDDNYPRRLVRPGQSSCLAVRAGADTCSVTFDLAKVTRGRRRVTTLRAVVDDVCRLQQQQQRGLKSSPIIIRRMSGFNNWTNSSLVIRQFFLRRLRSCCAQIVAIDDAATFVCLECYSRFK